MNRSLTADPTGLHDAVPTKHARSAVGVDAAGADCDMSGPIEIAERVWWVGSRRPDDTFQCHAYLIEAGTNSVLIDPGSVLTIDETLRRAEMVVPLSSIRWIVCHHSDPDVAGALRQIRDAMPRPDLRVVTEWRAETLLRHYGGGIPFHRVEDHGWALELEPGRDLRFVLTPYLHFPGAMCSYEEQSGVLFSSDLFGGFTDGSQLFATDGSYFEAMRPFHEHYMPSREILAAGLGRITREFGQIALIAPQHGCIIPEPLVEPMITRLAELECGIFLLARDDLDVARLLQVSSAMRRITDALVMAHDFPELAAIAERVLPDLLPVTSLEFYANSDDGLLHFSPHDGFSGTRCDAMTPPQPGLLLLVPGDGPEAHVAIGLGHDIDLTSELQDMFIRLAPAVRVALNRHLELRHANQEQTELREQTHRDPLTGLHNRRALDDPTLDQAPHGVLMIDIDHFKHVNDTYGHHTGDEVLRQIAAAIESSVRPSDLTIRYGGEEIVVLLAAADRQLALAAAERIRTRITELRFDAMGSAPVTVSIGAAIHQPGHPLAEAVVHADECLYRAKSQGRNRVVATWNPQRISSTVE